MEFPTHARGDKYVCGYFLPQLGFHGVLWSERCTGLHILLFTSISMASVRSRFQQQHQQMHPQPTKLDDDSRGREGQVVSAMPN